MYPNPFDRKHSSIRQAIDKLLSPKSLRKNYSSPKFGSSASSTCSASSASSSSKKSISPSSSTGYFRKTTPGGNK